MELAGIKMGQHVSVTLQEEGRDTELLVLDVQGGFIEYQELGQASEVMTTDEFVKKFIW